ncbi:MAG TPA: DUF5995 family protein [Solirubrobacterales bacterium]|nr:DUF5995 family protein [Solirubrobacterales bacterium]
MSPGPSAAIDSVAEVLARLEAIEADLPQRDGVKWFNRLYLEMTQQVAADPPKHEAAPGFLAALDVVFARRYFAAYEAAGAGPKLPASYPFHAWKPLFESRFEKGIAPVQFALAGMNAHINHDLSIALVASCEERGVAPSDGSPEHRDYQSVNGMIAKVEEQMKSWMMTGLLKDLDQAFDHLDHADDVVAVWDVEAARDAAWVRAEVLWKLRDLPPLRQGYEEMNDRATGFASRALLTPT